MWSILTCLGSKTRGVSGGAGLALLTGARFFGLFFRCSGKLNTDGTASFFKYSLPRDSEFGMQGG